MAAPISPASRRVRQGRKDLRGSRGLLGHRVHKGRRDLGVIRDQLGLRVPRGRKAFRAQPGLRDRKDCRETQVRRVPRAHRDQLE